MTIISDHQEAAVGVGGVIYRMILHLLLTSQSIAASWHPFTEDSMGTNRQNGGQQNHTARNATKATKSLLRLLSLLCIANILYRASASPTTSSIDPNAKRAKSGIKLRRTVLLADQDAKLGRNKQAHSSQDERNLEKYRQRGNPEDCDPFALDGGPKPCRGFSGTLGGSFESSNSTRYPGMFNEFSYQVFVGVSPQTRSMSSTMAFYLTSLWNETMNNMQFYIHPTMAGNINHQEELMEGVHNVHELFDQEGGMTSFYSARGPSAPSANVEYAPGDPRPDPPVLDQTTSPTPNENGEDVVNRPVSRPVSRPEESTEPTLSTIETQPRDGERDPTLTTGTTRDQGTSPTTYRKRTEDPVSNTEPTRHLEPFFGIPFARKFAEQGTTERTSTTEPTISSLEGDEPTGESVSVERIDRANVFDVFHVKTDSEVVMKAPSLWLWRYELSYAAYWSEDRYPANDEIMLDIAFNLSIVCNEMRDEIQSSLENIMDWGIFLSFDDKERPPEEMLNNTIVGDDDGNNHGANPTDSSPVRPIRTRNFDSFSARKWDWQFYTGLGLLTGTVLISAVLMLMSVRKHRKINKHHDWGNLTSEKGMSELLETGWVIQENQIHIFDKSKMGYQENSWLFQGGFEQRENVIGSEVTVTLPESVTTPDTRTSGS